VDSVPLAPKGPPSRNGIKTVVVIEDDAAARDSIAVLLEVRGYTVQTYPSAIAFLESMGELEGAALILDGQLDGITCFDVLDTLRRSHLAVPTILFTGLPENTLAQRTAAYEEVIAVLRKPLGGEALVAAVETAFGG
jgi:two-component system, LuxR family, response regulator FixJ